MKRIITVTLNPCTDKTIELNGFYPAALNRAENVRCDAGGKGINVAKVLKNFGAQVLAMGVVGQQGSEKLVEELDKRQISHSFSFVPGETRTNYKIYDRETGQITEINEPGFIVEETALEQFVCMLEAELNDAEILVLSGSVAPGISEDVYARLINLAKLKGVKTILDADNLYLQKGLEAKPAVIKPNIFELERLLNRKINGQDELLSAGRGILEQGVELLIVSMGENGALFLTKEASYYAKPAPVVSESAVGAGDSMVAATAFAMIQGLPLDKLAQFATAAGTVTACKKGSEVCSEKEVCQFLNQVSVHKKD